MRKKRLHHGLAVATLLAALAPATAFAVGCSDLAAFVTGGTGSPATSALAGPVTARYCQVDLLLPEAINIRVGLPLNAQDGGTGGVQGAWNGKVQNMGGGGYAGSVGGVTGAGTGRYVLSSTDTGHSNAWCNAGNSQTNCGEAGGGFVLDPATNLVPQRVTDFINRSLYEQVHWSLDLAKQYYSMPVARNYWNGCSTGGRQGWELAQTHPELFDGLLVGAPAFNWNRFIIGEMWPPVVAYNLLGAAGLSQAKSNAANAAAIAACDVVGGAHDGYITEPRRCTFDANALLCTGNPGDPATCLTPQEATAVNMIWDGPRNQRGERLWGGITRGTSFSTLLPGGNTPGGLIETYLRNWMYEDPAYDYHQIAIADFSTHFQFSDIKFKVDGPLSAATDNVALGLLRSPKKTKIITYHGTSDPLIVPYGSHNYASRLFDRFGVIGAQSFVRTFFFPGQGHCGIGGATTAGGLSLFDAVVDWAENGNAPDYLVTNQNLGGGATRTRKVCKYPDDAVYNGSGNPNDQANFHCAVNTYEPADLKAQSQTAARYAEAP